MLNYPLHHIGIAVKDLDKALAFYQKTFGFELDVREKIESQGVELVFLKLPNTLLELLTPISANSKLQRFLDTRGEGLHHICYKVKDIKAELARLAALGCEPIDQKPRPGAYNSLIAFLHPKHMGGVLVELCQTTP